jgi:hypothetical protein
MQRQKPLTYDGKGLFRENSIIRILSQKATKNQVVLEIQHYIHSRQLTDAVTILESRGIVDELAFLLVASLQELGGGEI